MVLVVKHPPAKAGDVKDMGLILGGEDPPGGGPGNPLQYSCLETPMDRGAWRAIAYRVTEGRKRLKQLSTHECTVYHISERVPALWSLTPTVARHCRNV